jgi:spore coat protein Y
MSNKSKDKYNNKRHKKHEQDNCILDALENIIEQQPDNGDNGEITCPTSCFSDLLDGDPLEWDTVPLIIYNKNDDPLVRFGNVGGLTGDMTCFKTIFFRVEAVKDGCVTLS